MFGLPILDILVILLYFLTVVIIGFWAMKRIKSQEDYFLAGRRFGKLIQTFAAFGQATSSDTAVSTTTTTVKNGASGIWSALCVLFATPVFWMTSPWYRRMRLLTLGDFFEERYCSKPMGATYAVVWALSFMIVLSMAFNALSKTVMALTPKTQAEFSAEETAEYNLAVRLGELESVDYFTLSKAEQAQLDKLRLEKPRATFSHTNKMILIFSACIIVLIYAVAGGLEAAYVTDTLQGFFIIVLSVILLPFALLKINHLFGGNGIMDAFRIMHEKLPESYFEIFGSPSNVDFTWYYIAALGLMVTINVAVGANQLVATGSAKDEYTARFGFTAGVYLKRFCTILWGLTALTTVVIYSKSVHDPDLMWGHATRDLLGPLNLGLVGLMIACLMAALMSSADCYMITTSGLLTRNLYRPLIPNKPEGHYVKIGRILGATVIIGGAVMAFGFDDLLQQMKFWWEFGIIFAAAFWLGILWRRSNSKAAWASIILNLVLFFLLPMLVPVFSPGLRTNSYLLKMIEPRVLERQYTAREMDVRYRQDEITKWDALKAVGQETGTRPVGLEPGQKFTKKYSLPRKTIFWTKGIKENKEGQLQGCGMLNIWLILYDKLGFNLAKNPYALNETLRILTRTIAPFIIMFIVGYLTKPDDEKALELFYVKMKTPVLVDRQADERELNLSYANPKRFDHLKLFPRSQWEFTKWDKVDTIGFLIATAIAFAIIGILYTAVNIGA